jgi:hypothetical protein
MESGRILSWGSGAMGMAKVVWAAGAARQWGRAGLVLLVGMLLAGCESVPVEQGPTHLDQFQIVQIDVDFSRAERPLLVAELDGEISQSVSGSNLGAIGTRLGVVNQRDRQLALEQAISQNVKAHVRDAFTPLMRGQRPARAVVSIGSVFIRSRASLQQLTGARVFINGQKRPDNAQFVASIVIYDVATGIPVGMAGPITRTDDGASPSPAAGPRHRLTATRHGSTSLFSNSRKGRQM